MQNPKSNVIPPQTLTQFLSVSPTLPSQISHSALEWSNSSIHRPRLYATMTNSALRPLSCNWSRFSSFLGKYIAPQYGWWFHQRVGCSRTPLSFEHRRANPKIKVLSVDLNPIHQGPSIPLYYVALQQMLASGPILSRRFSLAFLRWVARKGHCNFFWLSYRAIS